MVGILFTGGTISMRIDPTTGAAVPALAAPLMPTPTATLALFTLVTFLHYSHFGVAMAALNVVTPGRMRGQVSAIMLFFTSLFGLGIGGLFDFLPRAALLAGAIGMSIGIYQHINVRFDSPRWWRLMLMSVS